MADSNTTIETLQAVTARLNQLGHNATLEYPGFVLVQVGARQMWASVGTANAYWGGDIENAHGIVTDILPMGDVIPSDSTDVDRIVTAIVDAMRSYHCAV